MMHLLRGPLVIALLGLGQLAAANPTHPAINASQHAARAGPECAKNSATITQVMLKDWDIWHAMSTNAHLKASFTIFNPGSGDEYKFRSIPYIDDGEWHECSPSDKLLTACQYRFGIGDSPSSVWFKLQWNCGNNALFEATVGAGLTEIKNLPLPVKSLVSLSSNGQRKELLPGV